MKTKNIARRLRAAQEHLNRSPDDRQRRPHGGAVPEPNGLARTGRTVLPTNLVGSLGSTTRMTAPSAWC